MTLRVGNAQDNFAAGMVRMAPHLLPPTSAWLLENLLLDETGSPYKRGGTVAYSDALGDEGLRFLWDGELVGGHRTVLADPDELAVLDVDDETVIPFGVGGMDVPEKPAVLDGIMYFNDVAYAGSRKAAGYSTGTITVTEGDATVVGSGTSWSANLDPGMLLLVGDRVLAVVSVTDDTHLELAVPWPVAGAAGLSYAASPVVTLPAAYHPGAIYGAAGERLFAIVGRIVYMTVAGDPTTWIEDEYHELPEGADGLGFAALGDVAYIFTTEGVYAITNVAFDLTDDLGNAQQRLELAAGNLVLWHRSGLVAAQEGIIVPALDGVWLFGHGPAVLLSASIGPLYDEAVRIGSRPGGAGVFKSHYLLPVLDGLTHEAESVLVCRLDRPIRDRNLGVIYPWTSLAGAGANVAAYTPRVREGDVPLLLAAERAVSSKILRYPEFAPDGLRNDHDGSPVLWDFISRDVPTGPLNENIVKKLRVRYELVNESGISTYIVSIGSEHRPPVTSIWGVLIWGSGFWVDPDPREAGLTDLPDVAPETTGDVPVVWAVKQRMRYFRCRLRSENGSQRFVLRSLELFVRPSGRM